MKPALLQGRPAAVGANAVMLQRTPQPMHARQALASPGCTPQHCAWRADRPQRRCPRRQAVGAESSLPATGGAFDAPSTSGSGTAGEQQQRQQQGGERAASPIASLLLRNLEAEAEEPHAQQPAAAGGAQPGGVAANIGGAIAAAFGMLAGLGLLACGGYLLREPLRHFLNFFIGAVDKWGPWGCVAYALVYTGLEVLAMPAVPLTMTAGVIFGPALGTVIVSISATSAATIAFLISRYIARDKILSFAQRNKRFAAIDRAISRNGLKFVTLLRLSPLLPLALSNWFYGLTSVDLGSYVVGSFFGMLPGTYAYVTAGHLGRAMLVEGGEGGLAVAPWQVAAGVCASLLAISFIGQMAKQAVEEADREARDEEQQQRQHQQQQQQQQQQGWGQQPPGLQQA